VQSKSSILFRLRRIKKAENKNASLSYCCKQQKRLKIKIVILHGKLNSCLKKTFQKFQILRILMLRISDFKGFDDTYSVTLSNERS